MGAQKLTEVSIGSTPSEDTHFLVTQPETVEGDTVESVRRLTKSQVAELMSDGNIPSNVREAIYTLFSSAAYTTTGLEHEQEIIRTWAELTTEIYVDKETASISDGEALHLIATTVPSGKKVIWRSSNELVATVNENGWVMPVGNGTVIITASSGSVSASCTITVSGIATSYSVTSVLTHTTNSNSAISVSEGSSYSATISANLDYYLQEVSVVMDGLDVTDTVYNNGVINIDSVTGDVVITAVSTIGMYPLVNGTFVFSNGNSITVTNGNHVEFSLVETLKGWFDFSDITENTNVWDTADNVKNHNAKFTIPEDSTATLTISNFIRNHTEGDGACAFNAYGTGTNNLGMDISNLRSATGSTTKTFSVNTDCGCLFAVPTFAGTYAFDVSFTVDGVRYV